MQRTALITGGTTGIGAAISLALAEAGFAVVAAYYPKDPRSATAKANSQWLADMRAAGHSARIHPVDVTDYASCSTLAFDVQAGGKTVDVLVNNAGITVDRTIRKMEEKEWDIVLRTNLYGVFNMTKQFIGGMTERGFGRIISISSVSAEKGQFGQANYAAAKAGILGFTKAVALEVAGKGVTVNAVAPGFVETDMVRLMPQNILDDAIANVPVRRLGRPDEIAAVVAFLASDKAGFITGACIDANGGIYCR